MGINYARAPGLVPSVSAPPGGDTLHHGCTAGEEDVACAVQFQSIGRGLILEYLIPDRRIRIKRLRLHTGSLWLDFNLGPRVWIGWLWVLHTPSASALRIREPSEFRNQPALLGNIKVITIEPLNL